MINFVIIDDNFKSLNALSQMLEHIFIKKDLNAKIIFKTSKVKDLLEYIKTNKLDVLILDIELKDTLDGIDIAKLVRKKNKDCYIIFTTGHFEHVLKAYECKTFDFLQKPLSQSKLEECILRLFDDIIATQKKFIKLDNKKTIIPESDICYIKRDGMKLIFHTDSRDYEVYSSFAKIEEKLPNNFVRCHKSFIANINNISNIEPVNNIIHFNSSFCDIGPKYKNTFLEEMDKNGFFK